MYVCTEYISVERKKEIDWGFFFLPPDANADIYITPRCMPMLKKIK